MANYTITTPVNGTFTVPENAIDETTLSLNLIGRGVKNYGQSFAENAIFQLSNFAGPTAPNNPLKGQLWYDSANQRLKSYFSSWSGIATQAETDALATRATNLESTTATLTTNLGNLTTKQASDNTARQTDLTAFQSLVASTYAPLISPGLSGIPTAPTAAPGTSTNQLATTAFVMTMGAQFAPPGSLMFFAGTTAPTGWLKANGAAVSRSAYSNLFTQIGTLFGAGDGTATFNVPDLRGEFLRGWDDGRLVDAGRVMGSFQADAFGSHAHTGSSDSQGSHAHSGITDTQGFHAHGGSTTGVGDHSHAYTYSPAATNQDAQGAADGGSFLDLTQHATGTTSGAGAHSHSLSTDGQGSHAHNLSINANGAHTHNITVNANGGTETRPRNFAFLICIKY